MTASDVPPPAVSRMPMVAFGVSAACIAYGASLALQRAFPVLKEFLAVTIADGVRPTYFLRVAASLALGGIAAMIGARARIDERRLAWGTATAIAASVLLACAFP